MRRRHFIASAPMVGLTPYLDRVPLLDRADRDGATTASTPPTGVELAVDRWGVVPSVPAAPKLDGTLDDPAWRRSRPLGGFRTFYSHHETGDEASVHLLHDGRKLYVGVRYAADDAGASVVNFEALLSPQPFGGPFFRIPMAVRAAEPPYSNRWGADVTKPEDIPATAKKGTDAVTATAGVPFAALGVDGVDVGAQWRFNLVVQHEMMTKPFSSWMPVRTSQNSYSGGDSASVRAEVTDEGRLGAVFMGKLPAADKTGERVDYWIPEEPALTYLGFTEKELSFALKEFGHGATFDVDWRTPTTGWEPVTNLRVEPARSRVRLTFEHPGPLADGNYELRVLLTNGNNTKMGIVSFDRTAMIRAGDALLAS